MSEPTGNEIVIPLKHPLTIKGQSASELRLQRPKVKHLKALDGIEGDIRKTAKLIEQMGGLDTETVDSIDAEDFAVIAGQVSGFFG